MSSVLFIVGWTITGICIGGLIVVLKARFKK
ncbi:hypothetical protein SAMN05421578_101307 [Paenibacillus macquariensis]|uniref:MetS family NSS transporter small subunit n=1 Tax=Paenibacillus macquariensis TaxID=948756 RepID=A0ABY1JKF4_9BACL|nr:hypothetical protein SAMN05421578_101307 [Paenibacillus macquariensis]